MDILQQIRTHLVDVAADPAAKVLDVRLLEKFDGQVSGVQPAMPCFVTVLAAFSCKCLLSVPRNHRGIRKRCSHPPAS